MTPADHTAIVSYENKPAMPNQTDLLIALVQAAMKSADADAAWEGNPSTFTEDNVRNAEAARQARYALRDAVRKYRQSKITTKQGD